MSALEVYDLQIKRLVLDRRRKSDLSTSAVHHSNDRTGKRTSYESFAYELPASPANKTLWLGKMRIVVDF